MNGPQPLPREHPPADDQPDRLRQALAVGFELARNAVRARTLDEVQFVLVNDTRALLPFDRAFLLAHFGGRSELVAANNQPKPEPKSEVVHRINELAPALRPISKALVLFRNGRPAEDMPEDLARSLNDYVDYSGCLCLIIAPLSVYDRVVGHLFLEFYGSNAPGEVETLTLMNMVPFLGSALADKWGLENENAAGKAFFRQIGDESGSRKRAAAVKVLMLLVLIAAIVAGFHLPVTLKIAGRAEVVPDYEYYAYVQMDGIVESVSVKEGEFVKKHQVVAELESKEIDYKIREAARLLESHRAEFEILRNLAAENPQKMAESQ
ncbi:MAG: biotin/lipoyl-binding protein, partial [Pseudomonadota bacterium]